MSENTFELQFDNTSNPERTNVFGKFTPEVVRLFEHGLSSNDVCGFHGTTIEAVMHLSREGVLPTSGSYRNEFYFAQIDPEHTEEEQLEHAKFYAQWNVIKLGVLRRLPFNPKNMEDFMYVQEDENLWQKFVHEAARHGVSEQTLRKYYREAEESGKGVVLTLSHALLREHTVLPGDDHNQRKVITAEGFKIRYVSGIEPVGQSEWNILEQLQDLIEQ